MNLILFEQNEIDERQRIKLEPAETRALHLKKILKAETGTLFEAGIVNGKRGKTLIESMTDTEIILKFIPETEPAGLHPLTLILGLSRPPTVRKVLKEATALGICRFILCRTENAERSYLQSSGLKPERLHDLFIEGAQQACCTMLPEVEICGSIQKAVDLAAPAKADNPLLALDNVRAEISLTDYWQKRRDRSNSLYTGYRGCPSGVVLAVGSERGWTDSERKVLRTAGYTFASMGPRVLRTETASIAGTAVCLSGMGLI